MRPAPNTWSDTDSGRGILLFSQLLREMLNDQNFESFRAYSLGTTSRIDEAISVAHDVQDGRIPKKSLESIREELVWSMNKDPVVNKMLGKDLYLLLNLIRNRDFSSEEILNNVIYLGSRISKNYKNECENVILSVFKDKGSETELRHAAGFYCSYLINSGYSKLYILGMVNEVFFKSPMIKVGKPTLSKFFRIFDDKVKEYHVCVVVNKHFGSFLKTLGFNIYATLKDIPENRKNQTFDSYIANSDQVYLLSNSHMYDEYSAISEIEEALTTARALSFLSFRQIKCVWRRDIYVAKAKSSRGKILSGQGLPLQRTMVESESAKNTIKHLASYSRKIINEFDSTSRRKMLNSLHTSALARTSDSIENQLISLWSAVEILLDNPDRDKSRINHYVDTLIPLICLRYVRRQLSFVFRELSSVYKKDFSNIVNKEENSGFEDHQTKFSSIILMRNNNTLKEKLYYMCRGNPIALHRITKLHRDYAQPKNFSKALLGHEDRVRWQIRRIYRSRNNLVHSGSNPSYLHSIVINLDEYYRSSIGTITNRASKEEGYSSVDQLIASIGIEYHLYKSYLSGILKQDILTKESFVRLVL